MWIAIALHRLPYYELDQISERADNCVGTDPFHTPPSVHDAIIAAAVGEGFSVAVDVPFAGSLVPRSSYQKDRRILSVRIEVNRRLYMDGRTGQKRQNFVTVRGAVDQLIVAAAEAAIASGGVEDALC